MSQKRSSKEIYELRKLRTYWGRQIRGVGAWPCGKCGYLIYLDSKWHVGHIVADYYGGLATIENTRPEHARCNQREGGQMGASITNQKKGRRHKPIESIVRPEFVPDPDDEWNGDE